MASLVFQVLLGKTIMVIQALPATMEPQARMGPQGGLEKMVDPVPPEKRVRKVLVLLGLLERKDTRALQGRLEWQAKLVWVGRKDLKDCRVD